MNNHPTPWTYKQIHESFIAYDADGYELFTIEGGDSVEDDRQLMHSIIWSHNDYHFSGGK